MANNILEAMNRPEGDRGIRWDENFSENDKAVIRSEVETKSEGRYVTSHESEHFEDEEGVLFRLFSPL